MEITALGMIETIGLVPAIEAADAGLKAADVRLTGRDFVRGGLVMIRFVGEVAAVKASVEAGSAAAKRVGTVVGSHVIPRAVTDVFRMLGESGDEDPCAYGGEDAPPENPEAPDEEGDDFPDAEEGMPSMDRLKTWKVIRLRSFARKLPGFEMKPAEIRYANKEQLLTALENYLKN